MTRDEAIAKLNALAKAKDAGDVYPDLIRWLVASLEALGLIKFDEPVKPETLKKADVMFRLRNLSQLAEEAWPYATRVNADVLRSAIHYLEQDGGK